MPLNQHHDMSMPSPGYAENLRVVPDPDSHDDWYLVGDVRFEGDRLRLPIGGFSISFTELIRTGRDQELFRIYLPYPHHQDEQFVEALFEDGFTAVGRVAKKGAETDTIAVIATVVVAVLAPIWDQTYKTHIAPHVERFFRAKFGPMRQRGLGANFLQHLSYDGHEAQVMLVPARGNEEHCFSIEKTTSAMLKAHEYLIGLDKGHVRVSKIYFVFDTERDSYEMFEIVFADGSTTKGV